MSGSTTSTISEQENVPDSISNPSNEHINQQTRIIYSAKRVKNRGADDSLEREHRVANGSIQYFNRGDSRDSRTTANAIPSTSQPNEPNSRFRRPNFPPFRLNFVGDAKPSELSIIKCLNKHFRTNITYGRYTNDNTKRFLLHANTGEQFDQLMDLNAWPDLIGEIDYSIDLPSKVPASYSLVVLGVPTQWNLDDFENDIRKQYQTIVKVERLLVRGGVPIPKVRIDFSNNDEVTKILKIKKLIFDDENTSFMVQPYSPPVKLLRCFDCQMYNDHIASNCPRKNTPICFRCGENHPYDPKCTNKIRCANCQQEHMAGNPNCPFKIEARKKILANTSIQSSVKPKLSQIPKQLKNRIPPPPSFWFNNNKATTAPLDLRDDQSNNMLVDLFPPDLLMNKVDMLVEKQEATNANIDKLNQQTSSCQGNLVLMKQFIFNILCPYVVELSDSILLNNTKQRKEKLHIQCNQFKQHLLAFDLDTLNDRNCSSMLPSSSPNESNC